jgi:hypothetical protein
MCDFVQTNLTGECSNSLRGVSARAARLLMTDRRTFIESILERGIDMKYILISSILAATLGGCVILPAATAIAVTATMETVITTVVTAITEGRCGYSNYGVPAVFRQTL